MYSVSKEQHYPNRNESRSHNRLKGQDHAYTSFNNPKGKENPHKDLVIIAAKIGQVKVNRLLLDGKRSYDVSYSAAI